MKYLFYRFSFDYKFSRFLIFYFIFNNGLYLLYYSFVGFNINLKEYFLFPGRLYPKN